MMTTYKSEFEKHLASQNMAKRSSAASRERHRKDVVNGAKKTARGVKNTPMGNPQYATVTGGIAYAHKTGADRVILNYGAKKVAQVVQSTAVRTAAQFVKNSWGR